MPASPFAPRHFLSIGELSPAELTTLIRNASSHKQAIKSGSIPPALDKALERKSIAMLFTKLSTRTRVSTESAVATLGGHPMFLGRNDIQLGVNETMHDTSKIISSMTSGIVARVHAHSDVVDLARHSSVPVINALSDAFHPMQTIADFLTVYEAFPKDRGRTGTLPLDGVPGLGLEGLKIAWVGDANNVLFDLATAAAKLGVHVAVATPKSHGIPKPMRELVSKSAEEAQSGMKLSETNQPEEAVKNADVIVTDTWISMGQEAEKAEKLRKFEGFRVTADLAKRGGAKDKWRFMHCLPRHQEEVSDEVFYGPRSLVFQEGENRLWAAIASLEGFVVNEGRIIRTP